MSDEYQLRKDIDRLSVSIESIKNELIDVGVIDDDMNATQIMGNVVSLRSDLDDFNTSLTTLESSLNTLDTELNGDANTDGLVDYIDALKVYTLFFKFFFELLQCTIKPIQVFSQST